MSLEAGLNVSFPLPSSGVAWELLASWASLTFKSSSVSTLTLHLPWMVASASLSFLLEWRQRPGQGPPWSSLSICKALLVRIHVRWELEPQFISSAETIQHPAAFIARIRTIGCIIYLHLFRSSVIHCLPGKTLGLVPDTKGKQKTKCLDSSLYPSNEYIFLVSTNGYEKLIICKIRPQISLVSFSTFKRSVALFLETIEPPPTVVS